MPFGREIRLRRVKCLRAWVDLFHFTFERSKNISQFAKQIISHRRQPIFHLKNIRFMLYFDQKGGFATAESKLRDLSMNFAVEVLKMCDNIKGQGDHYDNRNRKTDHKRI